MQALFDWWPNLVFHVYFPPFLDTDMVINFQPVEDLFYLLVPYLTVAVAIATVWFILRWLVPAAGFVNNRGGDK